MGSALVIGAGPAGASLAYLLASRGVQVTLVERRRDFAREFRGEVLMPSGLDALGEMGFAAALSALPNTRIETARIYLDGREIFSASLPDDHATRIVAVSQPALLEMLVARACAVPGFRFVRGASVKGFLRDGQRISGARVRTADGEDEVRVDLVIGADGRHSVVRREAGITAHEAGPPMDVVWFKLPCPPAWRGARGYAGRGHLLIAYRTWDGLLQVGWVILKGTFGELRSRGAAQWADRMAGQVAPDLGEHIVEHRDALEHPFLLDVVSDCATRWSAGGALVIGDAAHTMSPVGGQGINIALRDAVVAANRLVPVLGAGPPDPAALAAALRAIEVERMPEVRRIQRFQAMPPRLILARAWWGNAARSLAGWLLRQGVARRGALVRANPFFHGVTEVRLTV